MEPVLRACPAPCRCALVASLLVPALARAESASADTHYGEEIEVTGHYENAVGTSDAASAGRITSQLVEDRPSLDQARYWNWCRASSSPSTAEPGRPTSTSCAGSTSITVPTSS